MRVAVLFSGVVGLLLAGGCSTGVSIQRDAPADEVAADHLCTRWTMRAPWAAAEDKGRLHLLHPVPEALAPG